MLVEAMNPLRAVIRKERPIFPPHTYLPRISISTVPFPHAELIARLVQGKGNHFLHKL